MPEIVAKALGFRSLNEEARTVEFVASTDAIDSYDEIVEQSWDLTRFRSNPVILFGHNSRELPVGKATRIEVVNGQLECTVQFVQAAANPMAEQVWQCVKEGALRAVSVGFVPGSVRFEKRNGKDVYVLSNNVLHEVSVVPIPANHEALAKMRSKARETATTKESATARHEETKMDEETKKAMAALETKHAEAAKDLNETRQKLAAIETRAKELETTIATVTAERDAALAAEKATQAALDNSELDVLVGVKILPEEKANLLELAGVSRSLFTKTVEAAKKRPDMPLLKGAMPPAGPTPPTTTSAGDAGADLDALVHARLAKAS